MKRLSLVFAVLLVVSAAAADAHEGSIGLYTSEAGTDCDATFVPFVAQNVYIVYYRSDAGPDGIRAAEFKISHDPAAVILQTPVWSPSVAVTLGSIGSNMSVSFAGCTGVGIEYLYIGYVPILAYNTNPWMIMVATSDDAVDPPFSPRVAICDQQASIVGVLGGFFSAPEGSCNVAVEETSWGAIKGMYQ